MLLNGCISVVIIMSWGPYTLWVKKWDAMVMSVISPNVYRFSKKKFTVRIDSKFAIKLYLKIPPCHNHAVHYLVKYLCSKNRRAQEVSAAKCLVDLATQKNCFKIFVWWNKQYLFLWQKDVHISHIKNCMTNVHNCCNKENDVAAKCYTWSAVGQSLMASVC